MSDTQHFMQSRVRLYMKTLTIVFASFTLLGVGKYFLLAEQGQVEQVGLFVSVLAIFVVLVLVLMSAWALLARSPRSLALVGGIESVGSIATLVALAIMTLFSVHVLNVMGVLLSIILVLVLRAAFVPSSARRTVLIGAIATIAVTYFAIQWENEQAGLDVFERSIALACAIWTATFAGCTALQSRILYGLHKSVRTALQLGSYTLEKKLGEGGMASVYRAKHAFLRRPTVIKLLPMDTLSPEAVTRFEREVQDTAALRHPNIVEIYDFGRTPSGQFYYAMEYISGLNLAEQTKQFGRISGGRMIYLLSQVAHALGHAHQAGLVHRDVKPGNILVSDRGGVADFITLLDFGLVKELDRNESPQLSQTNALLGTPLYMAPESILHAENADHRVDIYALGAVGFFLLTGEELFPSNSVVEVCGHHLHTEAPSPSERLGKKLCSPQLEAVLHRCLKKNPEERYADAYQLRSALVACPDASEWNWDRAAQWWSEHEQAVESFRKSRIVNLARNAPRIRASESASGLSRTAE